jgi:hypothetical protein
MTICEQLSDRMPGVAGGDRWTTAESAHLASCADCAAEWALIATARGLGAAFAGTVNADHVTERILGRLRAEQAAARSRRRGLAIAGLAAAAVIALAVWTGSPVPPGGSTSQVASAADLSLVELDSLRAPELEALLQSMDPADDSDPLHAVPSLLDDGELDNVLDALEG